MPVRVRHDVARTAHDKVETNPPPPPPPPPGFAFHASVRVFPPWLAASLLSVSSPPKLRLRRTSPAILRKGPTRATSGSCGSSPITALPLRSTDYKPLTTRQKFKIALDDTFDRGTVALAAAFAGEGQLKNSNPSFGQEELGYTRYFAAAYAGLVIGNYMTEAVYPTLLHQDPRYFRRGTGSGWSRLGYAVGQIFWTHTDSGGKQFNYSEIVGNSTAVAISTAYYPGGRDVNSALSQLGSQIGVDMASNVLKEFWPDLHRRLPGRR